jgi:TolA-binding protein
MTSTDYAYPLMALAKLDPDEAKGKARLALTFLRRQMDSVPPASKGALLYNQGLLLMLQGKKDEAIASFQAGAEAGPAGMVEYLNRDAIRRIQ